MLWYSDFMSIKARDGKNYNRMNTKGIILKTKSYSEQIDLYLKSLTVWRFIALMVFLTFLAEVPLKLLLPEIGEDVASSNLEMFIKEDPAKMLLGVGIISPLFETFVFQVAIIYALQWLKVIPNMLIMIISGLLFSLAHLPDRSLIFLAWAFCLGVILAYSYISYQGREEAPFAVVFCIHAFRNMISVFVILFTGPISP